MSILWKETGRVLVSDGDVGTAFDAAKEGGGGCERGLLNLVVS
jgi:hypothetical protein